MESLNESLKEFERELKKGKIQKAYKGIFNYLTKIRITCLENNPSYSSTGSIYHGYLDMSYFPLMTDVLKKNKLNIAIVFNYKSFKLEAWLSGSNKSILKKFWKLFKEKNWNKYPLVKEIEKSDSVMEYILRDKIDLDKEEDIKDIAILIKTFIEDIESFILNKKGF